MRLVIVTGPTLEALLPVMNTCATGPSAMDDRLFPTITHRNVPAAGVPVYSTLNDGRKVAPAAILMLRFSAQCKSNCSAAIEAPPVVNRIGATAVWPVPSV